LKRFATLLGFAVATCTAAAQPTTLGLLVLHSDTSGALTMSGNGRVLLSSGNICVNSTSDAALTASGSVRIDVPCVNICGRTSISGSVTLTGAIVRINTPYSDPLSYLSIPTGVGMVSHGNRSISSGTVTLQPGRYGDISISSSPNVTFAPGTYVIKNLSVSGAPNLQGTGVTLVLHDGAMSLSGQGQVNISAPVEGPLAGVVIAQRSANTSTISLSGGVNLNITGSIYAPSAKANISGEGNISGVGPQMGDLIVVRTATLSGDGTIKIGRMQMRAITPPVAPLFD
jgi:hypothetical protein